MTRIFTGAAVAILFLGSSAIATAAAPLNLQDSVRFALAHNTSVAAKKAQLASAQAAFTKQHAAELPPVTGTLQNTLARSANAGGSLAQYGISPQSKFSQNTAQVSTQWLLYNGSLNQILTQETKRQLESAKADLRQTQTQITQSVVASFFAVSAKDNAYQVAQSNLAYQQVLFTVAQAKEKAGQVAGVDVLRADAAVQNALAASLTAQSDAQTARETLAQLIGAPLDAQFTASQSLPEPPLPTQPLPTLVQIAQQNRPEIAMAAASLAVAHLSRAAIDTDLRPQIALNGSFGNQMSPTAAVAQQDAVIANVPGCSPVPTPAPCILPRGTPGYWQVGATSTFSMPLIDYGTRHTAHESGDAAIRSAELALTSASTAAEGDVRQSLRGAQTAAAALVYQKKAAQLATESARIAQLQYKNGLITLTDATQAQNAATAAQTDLFNARIAYINSIIKLRSALGTFDPAGLVSDL
jgi:outer membrane protein TolC